VKSRILNPIDGTVLTKYTNEFELATSGKPLYKVADLSQLTLRAYVSGDQLTQVKLGTKATVFVDDEVNMQRSLEGIVEWVSDKAEFTPKTIQTKNERANLVYATKIRVKNDGTLKIGMYAEVKF
jgi:HlyD family secretion protein